MKPTPTILLTFDVEEFDLPLEFNKPIELSEQLLTGKKGLDEIESIISGHRVETTMFTTARFAIEYKDIIKRLSINHEIASHTFSHTTFEKGDLLKSRLVLEEISGKPVTGLRMPRMKKVAMDWVKDAGYQYDSSINPTYIPGRYNNRHLPRVFYREENMLRLPTSVTPNLRIPLFWLAFKNFPYPLYRKLALLTLRKDGYLSLYYHSWEFTDVSRYPVPKYLLRNSGQILADRLRLFISDLKEEAEFKTIQAYIDINKGLGEL